MINHHRTAVILLACVLASRGLAAQQTRDQRIAAAQQAYQDFYTQRALDLLRAAVNPTEGPQDSVWARGVQLLAQILTESGDAAQAGTWLRWAFRLAPKIPIDTINFLPQVVEAMRSARGVVAASAGDLVSRTTWLWSAPGAPAGQGRLQVSSARMTAAVNAVVQGPGLVQSGQAVNAAPGTYGIQAAADGYLPTQLTREVLPGVTTMIEFNLTPVSAGILAANVRTAAFGQLVGLSVGRFGSDTVCATGAFVGSAGLVLTSYVAIRGADRVSATVGVRRFADEIRVLAWDVARNVAVLQIPVTRTDSLALASQVTPGQFVWGLGFPSCQAPSETRARLGAAVQPRLELADSIRETEHAGPLINSDGRIAGLLTGTRSAAPTSDIQAVLDAARRQVSAPQKLTVAQVALRENHAYGSVAITADVTGATARVTPLETWHWPALAWNGSLPHTFAGPMGRYQLDVDVPGQQARRLQFTIRPGAAERLRVPGVPVAAGGQAAQVPGVEKKGGGFPWPIALVGAGGAGAAAYILLKGGGPTPPPKGGIAISFPNPP
jgi:hypothetical protein